jgi:hypothetical protein
VNPHELDPGDTCPRCGERLDPDVVAWCPVCDWPGRPIDTLADLVEWADELGMVTRVVKPSSLDEIADRVEVEWYGAPRLRDRRRPSS